MKLFGELRLDRSIRCLGVPQLTLELACYLCYPFI